MLVKCINVYGIYLTHNKIYKAFLPKHYSGMYGVVADDNIERLFCKDRFIKPNFVDIWKVKNSERKS